MSEIEPALSPEEWNSVALETPIKREPLTGVGIGYTNGDLASGDLCNPYSPVQLIALLNHELPDADPRKITRPQLEALKFAASVGGSPHVDNLIATLESYLPPEGT